MFQIGDYILYGSTGVCKVQDIQTIAFSKEESAEPYYILQPLNQTYTISTPAKNTKVFMRPTISKEDAIKLIDHIPDITPEAYHNRVIRELAKHYESIIDTHDCSNLIELTMSLNEKKRLSVENNRKFGNVDEQFMKRAKNLLFGEFSVALGIPTENVPNYIAERVKIAM